MMRRHNDPLSTHERARTLASIRLDEPLPEADAQWLEAHLDGCDACRAVADAYLANRALVRSLSWPEPPRDLWVRTSAALERERSRRQQPAVRRSWRISPLGVGGALATFAVLAMVGFLLGRELLPTPGPQTALASPAPTSGVPLVSVRPIATPLSVPAGDVAWMTRTAGGEYALNVASVDSVCPAGSEPDCATLDSSAHSVIELATRPQAVVLAPNHAQAAIVQAAASGSGNSVLVVPLTPTGTSNPAPGPITAATAAPSSAATPGFTPFTAATRAPSTPVAPASAVPPSEPSAGPTAAAPAATAPQSTSAGTPAAGTPTVGATPGTTPAAGSAAIPIISNVTVVGDVAYSPDGAWVAFSARPFDGSAGPDIYAWHAGDKAARALTSDHGSVFSGWLGGQILGSRERTIPSSVAGGADQHLPSSFMIDPASAVDQPLDGFDGWRPVVDPSGRWFVAWIGSLRFDPAAMSWLPDQGELVLAVWPPAGTDGGTAPGQAVPSAGPSSAPGSGQPPAPDASEAPVPSTAPAGNPQPGVTPGPPLTGPSDQPGTTPDLLPSPLPAGSSAPSDEPVATPAALDGSPAASLTPSPGATPAGPIVLVAPTLDRPVQDWEVRWDPAGRHIAVWVADPAQADLGRLSIIAIDPATGRIDVSAPAILRDAPAMRGFALGNGRIAWATPPGQDGNGSRLEVLAWAGPDAGRTSSDPAPLPEGIIVIQ